MKRIAVFARRVVAGRVKTRLSPALPAREAAALYRGMLKDTIMVAALSSADQRHIYWAEREEVGSVPPPSSEFQSHVQSGPDLGARLVAAFDELLDAPDARAIVIGSDCPELESAHIAQAFEMLESHDLVLGPSADGGYVLIGLTRRIPELFDHIPWSTNRVLADTLRRARDAALHVAMLPPLADIDTPADLVALIARAVRAGETFAGESTAWNLREMGLLPYVPRVR